MSRIEQLTTMLAKDPGDPFLLYALAQEHAKQDHHEDAIVFYDRCLAADAAYCYAYYHKARSLESLNRLDEAVATLLAGIQAAQHAADTHAQSELKAYLDMLT